MTRSIDSERKRILQYGTKHLLEKASSKIVITPENIAHLAYPIANFIHREKPDYILAFDRGARIIASATHMLYQNLYGELPTQDHKINFRKISRKVPQEEMRSQFKKDVEEMLTTTENPTVLLLDDWVITGGTKDLAKNLVTEFSDGRIKVLFGVMRGKGQGADISGDKHSFAYYSWRNNPELLGVDYDGNLEPKNITSPKTIFYRKRIANGVRKFTERIKSNNQEDF